MGHFSFFICITTLICVFINGNAQQDVNIEDSNIQVMLAKSFQKRKQLDENIKTFQSKEDEKLVRKYTKWRQGYPELTAQEAIKRFCVTKLKKRCNWKDGNMLLARDGDLYRFSNEKNKLSMHSQWVFPTSLLHESLPPKTQTECERIDKSPTSEEFLINYVSRGKPVIISNGLKDWKAIGTWDIDYLKRMAGKELVKIYTSLDKDFEKISTVQEWTELLNATGKHLTSGLPDDNTDPNELIMVRPAETMFTFSDYLYLAKNYSNSEKAFFYLQKHDMRKWEHTGLLKDISPSLFYEENERKQTKKKKNHDNVRQKKKISNYGWAKFLSLDHYFIWLALSDTRGPIHFDENENIYAVIRGNKTFEIFHPSQNKELYETSSSYRSGHILYEWDKKTQNSYFFRLPINSTQKSFQPFSPVNISNPDYDKYPLHKEARKLVCELQEGDILYLPSYWYHEVSGKVNTNDQISIAINTFFKPWWSKGSDYTHFSLNPFYSHLHNNDAKEKITLNKATKLLDTNYWNIEIENSDAEKLKFLREKSKINKNKIKKLKKNKNNKKKANKKHKHSKSRNEDL